MRPEWPAFSPQFREPAEPKVSKMPQPIDGRSGGPNWRRYLRFWRPNVVADIDDELRFHFETRAEELGARGTAPEEIQRIILEEFGDLEPTRRQLREIGARLERRRDRLQWCHQAISDLRYTLRGLRRSPTFTAAVILTFGLGIGANAAIFSVVDRMLFRAPPMMRAPSRTHRVYVHVPVRDQYLANVSYGSYRDLARWTSAFDRTALYSVRDLIVGAGDGSRESPVGLVSASFFNFFDAPPVLGRYFNTQEDAPPNGIPVAVLSYRVWQTRYGGSTDILGKELQIGTAIYTVIGVAPRQFVGLWPEQPPDAYVPFMAFWSALARTLPTKVNWTGYGPGFASMLLERNPRVSIGEANADLTRAEVQSWKAAAGNLGENKSPSGVFAVAGPLLSERGPNRTTAARVAGLVGGIALLVLLVAGANVANLLMARALRRRRETAVRQALGASRARLVSQHLAESLVLASLGGGAGLVAAQWIGSPLRRLIQPTGTYAPVLGDERTIIFVAVVGILIGLLSGLAAASEPRRVHFMDFLKLGAHGGSMRRSLARSTLLILQAAFSVVLLVGAGLFVRSLDNLRHVRLGYDVAPVLEIQFHTRQPTRDSARAVAVRARVLAAARNLAGVEHAALEYQLPFQNRWSEPSFWVAGVDSTALSKARESNVNAVSPAYFAVMGTRLIRGRGIAASDVQGAPGAIVVSNALAKLLWPGKDALGQCVKGFDRNCSWVVGVAEDIKNTRLSDDDGLHYYLSAAQWHPDVMRLVLRTHGDASSQAETLRRALERDVPSSWYLTATPFADVMRDETQSWRVGATMFVAYGALALVLAAVGLYGVIAYDVEQRTHEIGVRIALGAARVNVLWLVVKQGLGIAAVGLGIGGGAAVLLSPKVAPLLFGASPHDPLVYAVVIATILVVAIVASVVPARRAAAVDPMVALAAE
jgi:putative ABC transport system permease protein